MNRQKLGLTCEQLEVRRLLAADPVISEFMASNRTTLRDDFGETSDWIEIHNAGDEAAQLGGWFLTDDLEQPDKWRFPEVSLDPGSQLLVFASGRDRTIAASALHTGFRLSAAGESLALIQPDGETVASKIVDYPRQLPDVSYGVVMRELPTVLAGPESNRALLVPTDDRLGQSWTTHDHQLDERWQMVPAVTEDQPSAVGFDLRQPRLLLAEFDNPGPSPLGSDAMRLQLAGASPEAPALSNPDGRLLMEGGGTGSAVFANELSGLTFEQPLIVQAEVGWETGGPPTSDANAYFGLVALHRQGVGSQAAERKGGLFAQAQPRSDGSVDLRLGFQTASTGVFRDSFVVTSSTSVDAGFDPDERFQLQLVMNGLEGADEIVFRVVQHESLAELTTTVGAFRRSLVSGSSVQLAFDAVLDDLRGDPGLMNVGLMSTRPFGQAVDNVDAYYRLEVLTQPAGESPDIDYADQIQLDVAQLMFQKNASAYLRVPFEIADHDLIGRLLLSMRYDDGFVAYLNGTEVARRNAPDRLAWDSHASSEHADVDAVLGEEIDLSAYLSELRDGPNMLAIHGLNRQSHDADFLLEPRLESRGAIVDSGPLRFFGQATPGDPNINSATVLGPLVTDVEHQPSDPSASDPIVVTATLADSPNTVESVSLTYRVMYGDDQSVPMRDDGLGADAMAGDRVYSAMIPAGVADTGEMLRYDVLTLDSDGAAFRSPFRPDSEITEGHPLYHGTVIRDEAVDTPLPVFSWFVPDPRWHVTGGGNSKRWSEASAYYDGQFYDNIRVRVRGLTTVNWTKPKFKFEFNDGDFFRYRPTADPVEEFNLQSHFRETGAVSYMGETVAFEWLREIGVPAPIAFPMHVRQNGEFYSLASFVEQIDETFLIRNGFDPDGAMYKANSAAVMSTLKRNPTPSHYRKITRQDESFADLVELTDGINNALDGIDRSSYIFDFINLPEVINDMAGNVVMPNHDRLTKNYYMHRDVNGSGLWSRFPWDMDQAFSRFTVDHFASVLYGDSEHPQSPNPIHQNHLYDAILDTPATREMYLRRVRSLVDEYLSAGYFEQRVDHYHALLAQDAALDHAKWRAGNINAGVNRIKSNLTFRNQQLEAEGLLPSSDVNVDFVTLLEEDAAVKALVPQDGALANRWTGGNEPFDETGWLTGNAGVGFDNGRNPIFLPEINLRVEPQQVCNECTSIYTRSRFHVDDPNAFDVLMLRMKYDDGFVAYLNGQAVLHHNVSPGSSWNGVARSASRETTEFADFDISAFRQNLKGGENILAIHTLNASRFSNDMLVRPQLLGGVKQAAAHDIRFGQVEFNPASGNQDEEFIEIVNEGDASVDLSGWQLAGGIQLRFQPGTVLPGNFSMYVSPNVAAFRARTASPHGGLGLFVQGDYSGHLSNFGETVQLITRSGEVVTTHTTPALPSDVQKYLRIGEVHYHPADNPDAEFIELTNISAGDEALVLDLTGVSISEGPSEPFVFEAETLLPPGESLLVIKDVVAMLSAFPQLDAARIAGAFEGRLNNGGEQLKVEDATGSTVVQFTYQDRHPWPESADGLGDSLQLLDLAASPDDPSQWIAARPTPGQLAGIDGDLDQDGLIGHSDIELFCGLVTDSDRSVDFNGDGLVDRRDVLAFIERGLRTTVGDANLDGRFDSGDLVLVFQAGQYEDGIAANSSWQAGDWDCDGEFDTSDLTFAFQAGGFVAASSRGSG